ncbi:MAG: hypothetical protein R2856_03265 [Caldilineaceae bacterium]
MATLWASGDASVIPDVLSSFAGDQLLRPTACSKTSIPPHRGRGLISTTTGRPCRMVDRRGSIYGFPRDIGAN